MEDYSAYKTPKSVRRDLAKRFKQLRRQMKISQKQLAARSGVSYGSIMRFEQEGLISLESLLKLSAVLGRLPDFDGLFKHDDQRRIEKLFES